MEQQLGPTTVDWAGEWCDSAFILFHAWDISYFFWTNSRWRRFSRKRDTWFKDRLSNKDILVVRNYILSNAKNMREKVTNGNKA